MAGGIVVPQRVYRAPQTQFEQLPPIRFRENGQSGVWLHKAFRDQSLGLEGSQEAIPLPQEFPNKVQIRILWPGYLEYTHSIFVRKAAQDQPPITKAELARKIAKVVHKFLEEFGQSEGGEPGWFLAKFPFERLKLFELRRVGQGSCQPVLVFV